MLDELGHVCLHYLNFWSEDKGKHSGKWEDASKHWYELSWLAFPQNIQNIHYSWKNTDNYNCIMNAENLQN